MDFEGGQLSSDGGVALLAELERQRGIVGGFAACFVDHRDPTSTEHEVGVLVAQRVFGLALGYEDLNDHEQLRADPLLAAAVGLADPAGASRR
ncbi:MAG TPA: transposase, partial [Thermoanaerobaculia bacterium]